MTRIKTLRLGRLSDLDRIIWEDRIEIGLAVARQRNFFLIRFFRFLSFPFNEFCLALRLLVIDSEEGIFIKEIKNDGWLEVPRGFSARFWEKGGGGGLFGSWCVVIIYRVEEPHTLIVRCKCFLIERDVLLYFVSTIWGFRKSTVSSLPALIVLGFVHIRVTTQLLALMFIHIRN